MALYISDNVKQPVEFYYGNLWLKYFKVNVK
jgi:hypothetical protein